MSNTQTNYQGLYNYAKTNTQNRSLYNEYWQQDQRLRPEWQAALSPELKRAELPTVKPVKLPARPITNSSQSNYGYKGLFDYARQNAVNRDLFKDSVHINLRNWQANLKNKKGSQVIVNTLKKAA